MLASAVSPLGMTQEVGTGPSLCFLELPAQSGSLAALSTEHGYGVPLSVSMEALLIHYQILPRPAWGRLRMLNTVYQVASNGG